MTPAPPSVVPYTKCRVKLVRYEIECSIELPYDEMPSVNAMVAEHHAVKNESGAFAEALADGRALN
jgi:hypothetical protein